MGRSCWCIQVVLSLNHKPPQNLGTSHNDHLVTYRSVGENLFFPFIFAGQNLSGSGGMLISAPCVAVWSGLTGTQESQGTALRVWGYAVHCWLEASVLLYTAFLQWYSLDLFT